MMSETVTLFIDGAPCEVPKGANLVDAAKLHGVDIPVFCYHPKLAPVGMCRMCLVELGTEQRDRATGQPVLGEDGKPVIRWFPKLQTACTTFTAEGMHVRTLTDLVKRGRKDVLEFILTSHPLDCPVCDKGGECPLQNLTMQHGPGVSRFLFDEKIDLPKHVPLGEQIFLDRERCIQCARCVRYCEEVVDDPVLAFHERGRSLQIISVSEPGFDSKFSGNTTDICPVGALTTADFRFGARPWELKNVPSICPYDCVGSNITLCVRLDRDAGRGKHVIKRVMPRQNEYVNEIWISDKTRFGHHFTIAEDRILTPLVRNERGVLQEATWEEALGWLARKVRPMDGKLGAIAGPTLSNEDLWALRVLMEQCESDKLGVWPANMTGGDLVAEVGLAKGSNFKDMGKGTCIVVVASDLEEEAPMLWHRVKAARDRGAALVVVNGRATKLDRCTPHVVRYRYGAEAAAVYSLVRGAVDFRRKLDIAGYEALKAAVREVKAADKDACDAVAGAENLVVIVGGEGMNRAEHAALMQAAANLLILTGRVGRVNNGLVAVWPGANTQGALDLGFSPEATGEILADADAFNGLFIAGADPVGEDPGAAGSLEVFRKYRGFIVVVEMFRTPTAEIASVVLPRLTFAERDGAFTNCERRVQRFYPAIEPRGDALPDWKIFQLIGYALDHEVIQHSAGVVMEEIVQAVPRYAGMSYPELAKTAPQFPAVGGDDLYYGGTSYKNTGGLGVQWAVAAESPDYQPRLRAPEALPPPAEPANSGELLVVPVRRLYDRGRAFYKTEFVRPRIPPRCVMLHPADAERLDIRDGERVRLTVDGRPVDVIACVASGPAGVALFPLDMGEAGDPPDPTRVRALGAVKRLEA
ncbi:MAG: NADH-quinone oxidoreductase subunit NuoG [Anaerolineae bacterium]|nr:NADH-quinone oxidoreductase subunit NuoG [Anaerolineae bacterium]